MKPRFGMYTYHLIKKKEDAPGFCCFSRQEGMKQEEAVFQRIRIGSHVTIIAGADLPFTL